MWDDPIVNEIRTAGEKLASKCDYDIHKFALMLKEKTDELGNNGWKIIKKEEVLHTYLHYIA